MRWVRTAGRVRSPAPLGMLRRRALRPLIFRILRMPPGRHDYSVTRTRVPMRDGVELLTDVYEPEGTSLGTVLVRTPYGRRGLVALLTAGYYASHGYHVVNQSCRGTSGSGGHVEPFSHEIADGADTVAWLRRQPWFGGRFALCGASYLGHAAWAVMMDPPPELVAAVIAVSAHDGHWVAHGAGAFSLEEVLGLMDGFRHLDDGAVRGVLRGLSAGRRLAPAFEELPLARAQETVLAGSGMPYREWLSATDPEDPLWRPMRLGQALERVTVPVLLHDGWQDRFPEQMITQYERLRRRGVDVALTIGPWTHVEVATKGAGVVSTETLDWLGEHLAGTARRRRPSPVRIYVTGAQEWRDLPTWPPATDARVLYLQPDGGLGDRRPTSVAAPTTFTYDPADPTPAVGGRRINPAVGGYRDNRGARAASRRPDLHQPTAGRTAGGDREPDRRGGARDRQSPCRSLRPRVRSTDERSVHQRERRVPEAGPGDVRAGPSRSDWTPWPIASPPEPASACRSPEERIRVTRGTSAPTRTRRPAATSHRRGARSSMVTAASPACPCQPRRPVDAADRG